MKSILRICIANSKCMEVALDSAVIASLVECLKTFEAADEGVLFFVRDALRFLNSACNASSGARVQVCQTDGLETVRTLLDDVEVTSKIKNLHEECTGLMEDLFIAMASSDVSALDDFVMKQGNKAFVNLVPGCELGVLMHALTVLGEMTVKRENAELVISNERTLKFIISVVRHASKGKAEFDAGCLTVGVLKNLTLLDIHADKIIGHDALKALAAFSSCLEEIGSDNTAVVVESYMNLGTNISVVSIDRFTTDSSMALLRFCIKASPQSSLELIRHCIQHEKFVEKFLNALWLAPDTAKALSALCCSTSPVISLDAKKIVRDIIIAFPAFGTLLLDATDSTAKKCVANLFGAVRAFSEATAFSEELFGNFECCLSIMSHLFIQPMSCDVIAASKIDDLSFIGAAMQNINTFEKETVSCLSRLFAVTQSLFMNTHTRPLLHLKPEFVQVILECFVPHKELYPDVVSFLSALCSSLECRNVVVPTYSTSMVFVREFIATKTEDEMLLFNLCSFLANLSRNTLAAHSLAKEEGLLDTLTKVLNEKSQCELCRVAAQALQNVFLATNPELCSLLLDKFGAVTDAKFRLQVLRTLGSLPHPALAEMLVSHTEMLFGECMREDNPDRVAELVGVLQLFGQVISTSEQVAEKVLTAVDVSVLYELRTENAAVVPLIDSFLALLGEM